MVRCVSGCATDSTCVFKRQLGQTSRFPQLTGGVCEQGLSNAWELIDTDEAVRSVRYLLSYQRQADGAFPQQVSPTGTTMFGQEGKLPRYHCHSPQDGSDIVVNRPQFDPRQRTLRRADCDHDRGEDQQRFVLRGFRAGPQARVGSDAAEQSRPRVERPSKPRDWLRVP